LLGSSCAVEIGGGVTAQPLNSAAAKIAKTLFIVVAAGSLGAAGGAVTL
jgi:hypothetical protein